MDLKITPQQLILVLAGWAFAFSAAAQYQWIGKDGRKVFSDRPPPSDIQEKNIIKQPGGRRAAQPTVTVEQPADADGNSAAATPPVAAAKPKADPNAPKISGKDAELEAKKKKLAEEEATKKKAEEEKVAQSRAENCERAKKAVSMFQSGVRVASTNAKGEREIMDDNARATELKRVQAVADRDCNKLPAQ
ncbi:MAG: DUF4124 domain-containing protein [Pseudomonadota bacterium]|uniref:DUF4124 domain-containing protein n=1 Tax=Polaromonas sp. TaxID=1869339 RepID=UPI001808AFC5|nr:DUF4124 domain-containing protein [Polaromonas sp.]MBA3593671.1 DUF4124 domain-containing protein [Polaromonas sp.]MDQ3272025.1 DUF4124 domain-containing protein [Pseudomonadota bacterium]